jgi:hypothetical protein
MSVFDNIIGFCQNPMAAEGQDSEYLSFANFALAELTAWFGRPSDADTPFEIIIYHRSVQSYDPLRRRYALFIRKREQPEPMLGTIAHEMFHRVTCRGKRTGLHKAVWIDEVLACSASRKVLEKSGRHEYVETLVKEAMRSPTRLTISELAKVRRWPAFAMLRSYPPSLKKRSVGLTCAP